MSDFQDVDDDGTQVELFKKAADLVESYYKSNVKVHICDLTYLNY